MNDQDLLNSQKGNNKASSRPALLPEKFWDEENQDMRSRI